MKLSIITVTFNAQEEIKSTLLSISSQSNGNYEHIVVDGGSTDNTILLINSTGITDILLSEKDNGLYDAMNKGASLANGDFLMFLNAGDELCDSTTIDKILFEISNQDADIFYGDAFIIRNDKKRRYPNRGLTEYWKGMPFSHQAMIIKRSLQVNYPYSLENKIASDFEFIFKCVSLGKKFINMNFPVVNVTAGGLSDVKRFLSIYERWKIVGFQNFYHNMYYMLKLIDNALRVLSKKILPQSFTNKIITKKYENK